MTMHVDFKKKKEKINFRKYSISLMKLEGLQIVNGELYKLMVHGLGWSMSCNIKELILVMK